MPKAILYDFDDALMYQLNQETQDQNLLVELGNEEVQRQNQGLIQIKDVRQQQEQKTLLLNTTKSVFEGHVGNNDKVILFSSNNNKAVIEQSLVNAGIQGNKENPFLIYGKEEIKELPSGKSFAKHKLNLLQQAKADNNTLSNAVMVSGDIVSKEKLKEYRITQIFVKDSSQMDDNFLKLAVCDPQHYDISKAVEEAHNNKVDSTLIGKLNQTYQQAVSSVAERVKGINSLTFYLQDRSNFENKRGETKAHTGFWSQLVGRKDDSRSFTAKEEAVQTMRGQLESGIFNPNTLPSAAKNGKLKKLVDGFKFKI